MEYKNDERYWNIKLLNKWFLIAASLWTLSMIWMFFDDNDFCAPPKILLQNFLNKSPNRLFIDPGVAKFESAKI